MNKMMLLIFILISAVMLGYGIMQYAGHKAALAAADSSWEQTIPDDGHYTGTYRLFGVKTACVQFNIRDRNLQTFGIGNLVTTPGHGVKSEIMDQIKINKNLRFDAVSGATISSQFVKAAITNAVKNKNHLTNHSPL